ncbi:hypothetical protein CIW52_29960 [Mycolicibacterium sp. P9-64]|nr:hypothetical protein CIW52_29960 [Mycolicibacterium sp. P9-64]
MLIDGQLVHFGVASAVCAGSSIVAGLIVHADDEGARRQHELGRRRPTVTRRRAAILENVDLQTATVADQQCPLCVDKHQTRSDSTRFAVQQEARMCGECAPAPTQSRHDELTGGLGASSDGRTAGSGAPGDGKPRIGVTWNQVGWRRTPDAPRVEVST